MVHPDLRHDAEEVKYAASKQNKGASVPKLAHEDLVIRRLKGSYYYFNRGAEDYYAEDEKEISLLVSELFAHIGVHYAPHVKEEPNGQEHCYEVQPVYEARELEDSKIVL